VTRFAATQFTRPSAELLDVDVEVECSSGTYVRALARDLGAGLKVGGHLTALRRTMVGPFGLAIAKTLEQLESEPGLSLDLDAAVAAAFPRRDVDTRVAAALAHGRRLPAAGIDGPYGVFDQHGRVIALAVDDGATARPLVVLAAASSP
jgi:tRNA pseudouridine55 synthase